MLSFAVEYTESTSEGDKSGTGSCLAHARYSTLCAPRFRIVYGGRMDKIRS